MWTCIKKRICYALMAAVSCGGLPSSHVLFKEWLPNLLSADHALLKRVVQKICLSCRPKTDKLVLVSGSFAPVHKIAQHMKLLYISNPNM
jgi:hypothetical protein